MSNEVRIKDKVPYLKSAEGAIKAFQQILSTHRRVQKISFDVMLPYLSVERLATAEEASAKPLEDSIPDALHLAIRNGQELQEYRMAEKKSPLEQVFEMFEMVAEEGLTVSHIAAGSMIVFRKWLRFSRRRETIFGVPVFAVPKIPSDVFVICGALSREAEPADIQLCIKSTLDVVKG